MKPALSSKLSAVSKEITLCLFAALLLILSFPGANFEFLAWIGFLPLFLALKDKSRIKAFLISYLTGVFFWAGIIYWLVHVTLPGTILLILYLALYFGFFGMIFTAYSLQCLSAYSLIFIPSLWVLLEYIRSHLFTGFPWALLGYSQYLNLPIIQISDLTGAWGVSFLVMLVNVAIYSALSSKLSAISKKQKYLLPALVMFFALGYGYFKIYSLQCLSAYSLQLRVSVIQGNIPQELKWNPDTNDYIIEKYLKLTRQVARERPDLIIWPEAALPVVLEEEPRYFLRVRDLAKEIKIPLLFGAVTARDNFYYNSALLISPEGKLLNRYDKVHLVPFGEYIPLKKFLPFLETVVPIGDIKNGQNYTVFTQPRAKFSVLICFEDLFPEVSRRFVQRGAEFLVNITNDAWYKKTSAPYQHLQASVLRAVENRVFLARAANTGISGFIAPSGKIISLVQEKIGKGIFVDGYKTEEFIIPKRNSTFYTRFGDILIVACFLFILYGIIRAFRKNR
jgi:apolipoprotein N-acyltransferase